MRCRPGMLQPRARVSAVLSANIMWFIFCAALRKVGFWDLRLFHCGNARYAQKCPRRFERVCAKVSRDSDDRRSCRSHGVRSHLLSTTVQGLRHVNADIRTATMKCEFLCVQVDEQRRREVERRLAASRLSRPSCAHVDVARTPCVTAKLSDVT